MKLTRKPIVVALIIDLVIVISILSFVIPNARAGALFNISDTISSSIPGVGVDHSVSFLTNSSVSATQTIKVTFDPITNAFDGVQDVVFGDISFTGATLVTSCSAGSNRVTLSTSTAAGDESIIFTVCGGNTVASGTKTITINNTRLINPTSTQSYVIRVGGSMADSGDAKVAIINAVAATANVATNFTFSISGTATGTVVNGATTTGATASTTIGFGTLSPNVPQILAQQLAITTNAANGFTVTVHEDQELTSSGGGIIHVFSNGNGTSTPSPWTSPAAVVNNTYTYGHIGVTTNDTDLSSGAFGTSTPRYAGSFHPTSTLAIFSATGPADGATQNTGVATVAYKIEISALQAAGSDYTNNLIYVATPSF